MNPLILEMHGFGFQLALTGHRNSGRANIS